MRWVNGHCESCPKSNIQSLRIVQANALVPCVDHHNPQIERRPVRVRSASVCVVVLKPSAAGVLCEGRHRNGDKTQELIQKMVRQDKKTLTINQPDTVNHIEPEEPVQAPLGRRKTPEVHQFRLQVDRQTKASFATLEAAEKAASAIKRAHPVVQVVVYDAKEGVATVIETTKSPVAGS
jgi:hypothetical protein